MNDEIDAQRGNIQAEHHNDINHQDYVEIGPRIEAEFSPRYNNYHDESMN